MLVPCETLCLTSMPFAIPAGRIPFQHASNVVGRQRESDEHSPSWQWYRVLELALPAAFCNHGLIVPIR
jgi:hypothetical protein